MTIARRAIALFFVLFFCAGGAISAETNVKKSTDQPIRITADRLEADNKTRDIVFSGSVKAVQDDVVITCRTMTVTYSGESAQGEENRSITHIRAKGDVVITQKARRITGQEAEYLQKERKIVVSGDPRATEGQNVIKGNRIIYFIDEDRSIIESGPSVQVEATIFPKEKPGKE